MKAPQKKRRKIANMILLDLNIEGIHLAIRLIELYVTNTN